jgi:hypothetical protein
VKAPQLSPVAQSNAAIDPRARYSAPAEPMNTLPLATRGAPVIV